VCQQLHQSDTKDILFAEDLEAVDVFVAELCSKSELTSFSQLSVGVNPNPEVGMKCNYAPLACLAESIEATPLVHHVRLDRRNVWQA
jgi:hypothetical protein